MLLCSMDLETTGLDPDNDQILEIGAVMWDTADRESAVELLPTFRCYVDNGRVKGNAFALSMNAAILRAIADGGNGVKMYRPHDVAHHLRRWALGCGAPGSRSDKVSLACTGKNFGSFDLQFLRRLENWPEMISVHHRVVDPGTLFFDPVGDSSVPGMDECARRAGLLEKRADGGVGPTSLHTKHDAVGDARIVIELLRAKWRAG